MEDKFLKPDYYIGKRKYEPKDVINALNCDFFMGNVLKYISRAGRKPGSSYEDDMKKAAVYLGFEIDIFDDSKDTNYLPNVLNSNWKFDSWWDVKEDWWEDTDDTLLCRQVFDQLYVFFSSHLEATRVYSLKTAKRTIENALNENTEPNSKVPSTTDTEIGVIVDKYVGDYTGSVVVTLYNLGPEDYTFKKGDKIVQIVFMPCGNFNLKQVFKFEDTDRGDNGFGSSGR